MELGELNAQSDPSQLRYSKLKLASPGRLIKSALITFLDD